MRSSIILLTVGIELESSGRREEVVRKVQGKVPGHMLRVVYSLLYKYNTTFCTLGLHSPLAMTSYSLAIVGKLHAEYSAWYAQLPQSRSDHPLSLSVAPRQILCSAQMLDTPVAYSIAEERDLCKEHAHELNQSQS